MSLSSQKTFAVVGILLILFGLLVNHWTVGYFFSEDEHIALLSDRMFIWLLQFFCLFCGVYFFIQRALLDKRRFLFSLLMPFLILLSIEAGLHVLDNGIRLLKPSRELDPVTEKKLLMSPYRDKEWARDLFREQDTDSLRQGKYVNLEPDGARKTWNPSFATKQNFKTIYMFGGSTIWGDGARDDYTIPSYLSKWFHNNQNNFIVKNYGEPAHTFKKQMERLLLLLKKGNRPDYVIFYGGVNDVLEFVRSEEKTLDMAGPEIFKEAGAVNVAEPEGRRDFLAFLQDNSMIYKIIMNTAAYFSIEEAFGVASLSQYNDEDLFQFSARFIQRCSNLLDFLKNLSNEFGFKYFWFWQPNVFLEEKLVEEELQTVTQFSYQGPLMRAFKSITRLINERHLPYFFNISDVLKDRKTLYYTDWCHLSEEGNEVVAEKIAEIFEKEFLK